VIGGAAFARRLEATSRAPIAVGFSGGGDSLAALLATKAFADAHGRRLIVLTVDHGLQAAAKAWTAFAAETAQRLGADFRALTWCGDKPTSGLPAAARTARHRLLADAARAAGARVIVLGHTADDILEAALMRQWGSNLGVLSEWSPSPAWPHGRGVFMLRPLLGERRAVLRAWLGARGERWIDDPANDDPAQTRARARLALAGGGEIPALTVGDDACIAQLARSVEAGLGGTLGLNLEAFRAAPEAATRRALAAAALSVGGGSRPPRGERVEALRARLAASPDVRSTLCGAKIASTDGRVLIARNAGEVARGGLAPLALPPGVPVVWDGRFELTAAERGLTVRPLAGLATQLDPAQRAVLFALPPQARPGLPAVVDAEGRVTCPILAGGAVVAHDLVQARMRAACGVISKEPAT
jgi:tRNA(Ile)-lysidine synthase